MRLEAQPRGRPVIAMVTVLAVWASLRVVYWQSPLLLPELGIDPLPASAAAGTLPGATGDAQARNRFGSSADRRNSRVPLAAGAMGRAWAHTGAYSSAWPGELMERLMAQPAHSSGFPNAYTPVRPPDASGLIGPTVLSGAGHGAFGTSQLAAPYIDQREPVAPAEVAWPALVPAAEPVGQSRWSMSSWLFWRDGSPSGRQAATTPGYGRSQAGAVLAYALIPGNAHRPQGYGRAVAAIEGPREADLAAGVSARPVPGLPLRLAAEARVSLREGDAEVRPAVLAITELPPLMLPAEFIGDAYAQAGWVGGDFATAFADAQARVARPVARFDEAVLTAGGGAWIGAQRDTQRVDIGPSASVSFRLGTEAYGRLSIDYRVRVAGNAGPASGPALTLSAGF